MELTGRVIDQRGDMAADDLRLRSADPEGRSRRRRDDIEDVGVSDIADLHVATAVVVDPKAIGQHQVDQAILADKGPSIVALEPTAVEDEIRIAGLAVHALANDDRTRIEVG